MMAPLSPSSISSADAAGNNVPSSPQPEATYENPLKAVMKSIAMFSPKNYSETQDDDSNNDDDDDKVNVSNDIKIDAEEVGEEEDTEEDAPHDEKSGSLIKESPTDEAKFEEEEEEELEATEDEQKPTSPTASTTDKPNKHKEKTVATPPSTTKSKKLVSFAEKNPPPLSPMSYQSSVKMLSPASSRDETITSDATSFDEGLNSPDQAISNNNNTNTTTSTALVDNIPDDESEASLMVLMRYMGCTPVPYGSGPQRKPRSTSDVDDHSLLSDQYTYDNDLHSKDTFDTIEPHEIDGIKKSWTLDNDEVGVELDLDMLMINDVKDRLKKHNNNNLSVNTNDNIEDVPSDEQNGGSVTSPEGTTTTTTEEEEGSRDVKFGAMLSVDEKLAKEKNENDGVGLTSFNNYLEKKGSASLQSESLVSPTVATNPGSPVVKFVTSPGGGVLSDDALHSFLADKEASVATGVPTSPVESTTSGLQRLPGGKLSIVTSLTGGPNEAAVFTSPVVKFVTSPGGGVLSDDALHSYLASNGAATTPAAVTVTLPSPTSGEVSKAMAKVAAYKKAMAEVKAASAAAESEKNSKKMLSSLNIDTVPSSQPSDTSFPVDVVQDVNDKVEETASTRSDKENQTDTVEVSSDSKTDTSSTKVEALAVETSPQDDTAVVSTSILSPAKSSVLSPTAKKSVQEVDELLSKTRDWLVRHNESQKKKVPSSSSEEQKVTGKTVLSAIENSETPPSSNKKDEQKTNNVTGKSVLNAIDLLSPKGTNNNISKESPKTLDEMLQSKKNGTSSNTALLAMLSPKSASEGRTTNTPPTTDDNGPKKSIMEQLEEIRIKQRELESRQPKAKQEEQIETS